MKPKQSPAIQHLEKYYSVQIDEDALPFAAQLLQDFLYHISGHCIQSYKCIRPYLNRICSLGSYKRITDGVFANESTLRNMEPINLVESACRMQRKIYWDIEERSLSWDQYYLDRAFVEVTELRKEKSYACRTDVLPRVEKELAEITSKWECFKNKWTQVLEQQRHESGKRLAILFSLRREMNCLMNTTKSLEYEAEYPSELPSRLINFTDQLRQTVHCAFKEKLIVGPCEVSQVASSLTDLPIKCFSWPFELRMLLQIEDLKSRLSKKLISLDPVVHKVGHALSKQKSLRGPLGSFLLLGPHGCGKSKLAEALAEEIYGDKGRCMKLDLSNYNDPHYVSTFLTLLARDKRNGSVIMFKNIENAHTCCHQVLSQILRNGRLTDGKEICVDFSNDLVLVSTHIGHEVFYNCECLKITIPKLPFREVLIEPALLHAGISDNSCNLHQFCSKVANQFKFEFLDLFSDVLVFPWLTAQNHMAISRLQIRDVAKTLIDQSKKLVILYPSDAAVVNMMCDRDILERGAHAYEDGHKVHMLPKLNDYVFRNEFDDMLIVYIDVLVGLGKEFSFRVENGRHLEKVPVFKRLKENLFKLRSIYHQEKQQVDYIYKLRTKCFRLCEAIGMKAQVDIGPVLEDSKDAIRLINFLLMHETSDSNDLELVQSNYFGSEAEVSLCDRKTKRAKICLDHVSKRLQRSLQLGNRATQAIIEALLRHLRTSYDQQSNEPNQLPVSFLCLGLTSTSKKRFVESLGEHLVMDDGEKLLFQVDLSLCTEQDSFFRCRCSLNTTMLLTEAVKKNPHSIIIFHQLEMAHISVFSTILSILDSGVAKGNEGNITNFSHCIVVFVSDIGNKEIIGKLNRESHKIKLPSAGTVAESTSEEETVGSSASKGEMEKHETVGHPLAINMGQKGLRYELLYRLDQLLLFDHLCDDQLNQFVMLPMRSLEEKSASLYKAFSDLLNSQVEKEQNGNLDEIIQQFEGAVGEVLKIS